MPMRRWWSQSSVVRGAPGVRSCSVTAEEWLAGARDVAAANGRLLALWASAGHERSSQDVVRAAFITDPGILIFQLPVSVADSSTYPGLEQIFPVAARMQRAARDLVGTSASDPDQRPWLRHAAWSAHEQPLRPGSLSSGSGAGPEVDAYEFVRVQGDGVHEIPVGPVHAGIIEPGHFRFSVVGEKVLKLEERLGYVHKGIERRFTELPILTGHQLAARVSGDSAVAFSWAYCQALEGMSDRAIPPRAAWLRALFLELERIANHLGDLGALGNDAGFAFGLAQFSRLKEQLLRATAEAFGQRYLMDVIVPGGSRVDLTAQGSAAFLACVTDLMHEALTLREIYEEHEGVRDRFSNAGILEPALASRLGVLGLAGRASGQAWDMRVNFPCAPYRDLAVDMRARTEGDVAARVGIRFDELQDSCRLVRRMLDAIPSGALVASIQAPADGAFGVGLIEGWRGPVWIALEAGANGSIRRCHPHDPSWQSWPALEHAIIGNIVPDFPLINKSFNLSYSGHDL